MVRVAPVTVPIVASCVLLLTVSALSACSSTEQYDGGSQSSTARSSTTGPNRPTTTQATGAKPTATQQVPTGTPQVPASPLPAGTPPPYIASATWATSAYGPTLKISPTPAGRSAVDTSAAAEAWSEVLRLDPSANTPGMQAQFDCHWQWARLLAPGKPTWNIEPWRPVVPDSTMLATGCNPGAPEV